jgi:hypothetical protein
VLTPIEMNAAIPDWALRRAEPGDLDEARVAHRRGRLRVTWPPTRELRAWSQRHGWPTPWFGFESAFLSELLASPDTFALGLRDSGVGLHLPLKTHPLPAERLREFDALYEERDPYGRPVGWGMLVAELRDVRRAVDAGVVVEVEGGPALRSGQGFYAWAHGRYHMLEDGADDWVGVD